MSKPFRFESLLNWAEQREEQQTLVLAAITAEERVARDALANLETERERAYEQFTRPRGPFDPEQHRSAAAYVERLDREVEAQQGVLSEVLERSEAARAVLMETVRERRSYEHLRDQDAATAAAEEGRREASATDDLNMTRHARRTGRTA